MGTLVTAVVTAIGSMLGGLIGGATLAATIGALLGIILQFMFSGSVQIIDLVTSDKFMLFGDVFSLLPYNNVNFKAIFIAMSITTMITISAWSFLKCMTAGDARETESPAQVIKRTVVTIIILVIFIGIFMNKTVLPTPDSGLGTAGGYATPFAWLMSPFKLMVKDIGKSLVNADVAIKPYISGTFSGGYVIACILGFMLIKGCVGAALVLVERLVALVVLISFGPIAIACNASIDTEEVFRRWAKTLLGTILAIILSLCLIRVFADQMKTWIDIEATLTNGSYVLSTSGTDGLTPQEMATCTSHQGVEIAYYRTSTGFSRTGTGEQVNVYWTRSQCANGTKTVADNGQDFYSSTQNDINKSFATEANTYRLILAIAWISLCAESEKIINQLGFTTTASGKMARDFAQTASSLWRTIQHAFVSGALAGGKIGSSLAKDPAARLGQRVAPPMYDSKYFNMDGKNKPLTGAMFGGSIKDAYKQQAKKQGEFAGKAMAISGKYGDNLSSDKVSNAIDKLGLTTSKGVAVGGEARFGERLLDGKEPREIRSTAANAIESSFGQALVDRQNVLDAISNKGKNKIDSGVVNSLNNSFFGLEDGVKATSDVSYGTIKDSKGNETGGLTFTGYVKDENDRQQKIEGMFVPESFDGDSNGLYDNQIKLSEGGGTVLFNEVDRDQTALQTSTDDIREMVNDGFNDVKTELSSVGSDVSELKDAYIESDGLENLTQEDVESLEDLPINETPDEDASTLSKILSGIRDKHE